MLLQETNSSEKVRFLMFKFPPVRIIAAGDFPRMGIHLHEQFGRGGTDKSETTGVFVQDDEAAVQPWLGLLRLAHEYYSLLQPETS